jgi:hypothetical protein
VWANPNQCNTPLVTEVCEGQVTVTDPSHPLYGRALKLVGLAHLPGHVRHCQVELAPGQFVYIPVTCTDLSNQPRPEPTVLTSSAVAELVAIFQAMPAARRKNHATNTQSRRVDPTARQRTRGRRRSHRASPHGGGGE